VKTHGKGRLAAAFVTRRRGWPGCPETPGGWGAD
jgi:hypothetical protein